MASFKSGSTSLDILLLSFGSSLISSMKLTWRLPSEFVGRPPPSESRPKDTSLGRGFGRAGVEVSILGGSRGEGRGLGEREPRPSGREDDMLARSVWIVLQMAAARATWTSRGAYSCKGHARGDWQDRSVITG